MNNKISLSLFLLAVLMLTACSKEKFDGDAEKDWTSTASVFSPTDEAGFSTYYMPSVGRVGDTMPFYDSRVGEYKIAYLSDFSNNDMYRYHPAWAVSTKDGASYQSLGEVVPVGASDAVQDAAIGTGCCIYNEADKLYYVYYTGHNSKCENMEVLMRSTSPDFRTWTKDQNWSLKGTDYGYSNVDFRDPQIFKDDGGLWHMLVVSNLRFADFTSIDLKNWTSAGEFSKMVWDRMLECPDVFKMGDWWYMIYSESVSTSWSRKVKYMKAKSLAELKVCLNDVRWPDSREGVLDSRAFYAAKTASNGSERLIWGWTPYRTGTTLYDKNIATQAEKDGDEPNWSGAMVCHKLVQHEDGTLTLGEVPAIKAKYSQSTQVSVMQKADDYTLYSRLGYHNHLSFTVQTAGSTDKFGISFVRGTDSKKYYTLVVNPEDENTRKINFEEEGSEGKGFIQGADSYSFSRPSDNTYKIDIYTDNSVLVMYINDNVCYTQRIYGIQKNCWSINNYGSQLTISSPQLTQY